MFVLGCVACHSCHIYEIQITALGSIQKVICTKYKTSKHVFSTGNIKLGFGLLWGSKTSNQRNPPQSQENSHLKQLSLKQVLLLNDFLRPLSLVTTIKVTKMGVYVHVHNWDTNIKWLTEDLTPPHCSKRNKN